MTEEELIFYRLLFMKRYAALLEKAEKTYKIDSDKMEYLRKKILNLDWMECAIQQIPSCYGDPLRSLHD
jgi:hypothetical protein